MATYKIKTTSPVRWTLTLLVPSLTFALIAYNFLRLNDVTTTVAVFLIIALTFFLQRFTSLGIITVNLTNQEISLDWLKQYIFNNQSSKHIPFSEIETYKYQPDQNFDLFELTLKDGSEVRFCHFSLTSGDDFDEFVTAFSQLVVKHNQGKNDPTHREGLTQVDSGIKRAKTTFELASAPAIVLIVMALLIAVPLIIYFTSTDRQNNSLLFLVAIPGVVFYLIQYYRYRKNRDTKS